MLRSNFGLFHLQTQKRWGRHFNSDISYDLSHAELKGKKGTKKPINTNVITSHNTIEMSCDLQSLRSSFSQFKHIYYFQFLIFEIIRFTVWFYVLSVIFPRLLISLNFVSLICF